MLNTLFLPEIREMLADNDQVGLREICGAIHPAGTADFMKGLTDEEAWQVLRFADEQTRTEVFLYFEQERQVAIIQGQDRSEIAQLINKIPPDDRVDLLDTVDDVELVEELLSLLPAEERRDIQRLSAHPENTAGAVMTTAVAKLPDSFTVQQALEHLQRQSEDVETIYYLYILDEGDHLRGLVSTRELISHLARPETRLADIMERELITVDVTDDQEIVAQKVAKYDLLAIPVVDDQHRMLGIITYDDVIDVMVEEAVEDAHRIGGVDPLEESYLRTDLLTMSRKRGVWLAVLFLFALVTALALKSYDEALSRDGWEWLVLFIPLVISSGGNTGSQSATLIITALVRGDISIKDWWQVLGRELLSGLVLGGFLAGMGFIAAYFLIDGLDYRALFVLPVTLLLVVISGTLCGAVLPLTFQRLGLDPALMSNPFRGRHHRYRGHRYLSERGDPTARLIRVCDVGAAVASPLEESSRFGQPASRSASMDFRRPPVFASLVLPIYPSQSPVTNISGPGVVDQDER